MVDYKPILVEELDKILPTYYELFVDSNTETPCITYMGSNDYAAEEGDTIRYSYISYNIKLWGSDIGQLSQYSQQVDLAMKQLGFKRMSCQELTFDSGLCIVSRYEALAKETI